MNPEIAYDFCETSPAARPRTSPTASGCCKTPERRALSAVYALARRIDDIGDGQGARRREARRSPGAPQGDRPDRPAARATRCSSPSATPPGAIGSRWACFGEIIDGCEMDVIGTSYETIDDLVGYCRRVAGSVGRLSLAVFGSDDLEQAVPLADALGVALQLTNILRDVVEDRSFGRVYLPEADAESVGCAPDLTGPAAEVARLVALECGRAERGSPRACSSSRLLDRRSRACVAAMAGIYRRLLGRIEREPDRRHAGPRLAADLGEGRGRRREASPGRGHEPDPHRRRRGRPRRDRGRARGRRRRGGGRPVRAPRRPSAGSRPRSSATGSRSTTASTCSSAAAPPTGSSSTASAPRDQVFLQPRLDVPVLSPERRQGLDQADGPPRAAAPARVARALPPPLAARAGAPRAARARAAPPRPGRRLARRDLVRRLAREPGPVRPRHRAPLGPDRACRRSTCPPARRRSASRPRSSGSGFSTAPTAATSGGRRCPSPSCTVSTGHGRSTPPASRPCSARPSSSIERSSSGSFTIGSAARRRVGRRRHRRHATAGVGGARRLWRRRRRPSDSAPRRSSTSTSCSTGR